MKATQLEECKRSYNLANIEKNAASDLLGDKVRNLDELHSQVKKWEEKFKVNNINSSVSNRFWFYDYNTFWSKPLNMSNL